MATADPGARLALAVAAALAAGCDRVVTFHLGDLGAPVSPSPDLHPRPLMFAAPVHKKVATQEGGLALADFDADRRVDVAVGDTAAAGVLLLNRGAAMFDTVFWSAGDGPLSLAAADFSGDGTIDLAVGIHGGAGGSLLVGNGDGTFAPPTAFVAPRTSATAVADMDGDGRPDLVTANDTDHSLSVHLSAGGLQTVCQRSTGKDRPNAIAVADFGGDALPDVAVAATWEDGSAEALVFINRGGGVLEEIATVTPVAIRGGDAIAAADLDGDGHADLAVANGVVSSVIVVRGRGDGTFHPDARSFSPLAGAKAVAIADLDGDGHLDLAVSTTTDVAVLLGDGAGSFRPPWFAPMGKSACSSIATADLDGDGALDVVTVNPQEGVGMLLTGGL